MTTETEPTKVTNETRKADKLRKIATKAHNWRVQVWAQQQRRIAGANAELVALGFEPVEPYPTDFNDPDKVEHYATMSLD